MRSLRDKKSNFFPSSEFFSVDFVTLGCKAVGKAFNNVDFVVYIKEYSGHLDSGSLVSTINVTRDINF